MELWRDDFFMPPSLVAAYTLEGFLKLAADIQIDRLGIPLYLARHPQHHITLSCRPSQWEPLELVKHHRHITNSLHARRWHALQVGQTWVQAAIPTLNLTSEALILGVGGTLVIHPLSPNGAGRSVGRAKEYPVAPKFSGSRADIVGVHVLPDSQLAVAQYDGVVQRFMVPDQPNWNGGLYSTAHFPHPKGSNIHTMTGCGDALLTTTSSGLVSLWNARSPWQAPATLTLPPTTRAWSTLLTPSFAYLGLHDRIAIHAVNPSSISSTPFRSLAGPDLPSASSAYSLRLPPPTSIHNPSILLSAWYDSHLRMHDLRSPSPSAVQTFSDPWTWADGSAMYSTAFLAEYHIAGGGARHGTVSLFDTRFPKSGWSCFSPGGKGSPVYAMEGEGGRLWGVTEKRAFVLAFDGSAAPTAEGGAGGGLVEYTARARRTRVVEKPNGRNKKGRDWGWSVKPREVDRGRYGDGEEEQGESAVGYDHNEGGGVKLFDSIAVP